MPAAKVWRTLVASLIVQPPMEAAVPPTFTISTNSPLVSLPGSLARISLMITFAGVAVTVVMVNAASLTSVAVEPVSVTRTLAVVLAVLGTVQVKLPADAAVLLVMAVQMAPPSSE